MFTSRTARETRYDLGDLTFHLPAVIWQFILTPPSLPHPVLDPGQRPKAASALIHPLWLLPRPSVAPTDSVPRL